MVIFDINPNYVYEMQQLLVSKFSYKHKVCNIDPQEVLIY